MRRIHVDLINFCQVKRYERAFLDTVCEWILGVADSTNDTTKKREIETWPESARSCHFSGVVCGNAILQYDKNENLACKRWMLGQLQM